MLEAVAGAQRLAFTLLRDVSGDAELYLSEIDSSNKRFTVSFDYAVGGTPLRFSDGSHAATVTIEGQTITEFSLRAAAAHPASRGHRGQQISGRRAARLLR